MPTKPTKNAVRKSTVSLTAALGIAIAAAIVTTVYLVSRQPVSTDDYYTLGVVPGSPPASGLPSDLPPYVERVDSYVDDWVFIARHVPSQPQAGKEYEVRLFINIAKDLKELRVTEYLQQGVKLAGGAIRVKWQALKAGTALFHRYTVRYEAVGKIHGAFRIRSLAGAYRHPIIDSVFP